MCLFKFIPNVSFKYNVLSECLYGVYLNVFTSAGVIQSVLKFQNFPHFWVFKFMVVTGSHTKDPVNKLSINYVHNQ